MQFTTYADLVEHGLDYLGGTADVQAERDCRRSVLEAYRDLMNARTWSYLMAHGRVITQMPYLTGTVAYEHTGVYERQVLLYGGTWPAWTGPGAEIRIGVVTHAVAERKSDSVLTLVPALNPGKDVDLNPRPITGISRTMPIVITSPAHGLVTGDVVIVEGVLPYAAVAPPPAANGTWTVDVPTTMGVPDPDTFALVGSDGTASVAWDGTSGRWRRPPTTPFILYQDVYLLPEDFIKSDTAIYEGNFGGLSYSDPTDELWWQRFTYASGTPRFYTLKGSPLFPGRLTIGFFPYPDQVRSIDYVYERRPRELRLPMYSEGTLSTVAGTTAVTGNGTQWTPSMAGTVLRVGTDRLSPTSWIGTAPPAWETVIVEAPTPTTLRTAEPAPAGLVAAARYAIGDPADVEQGAMINALLRGIEKNLAIARGLASKADAFQSYDMALKQAQAADSRSFQGRSMGAPRGRQVAFKYMPANFFPGG